MLKKLMKISLLICLSLLLTSCSSYYLLKNSYTHIAPEEYASSKKQPIYISTAYSSHAMHNTLFSDFLVIGKSSFTAEQIKAGEYISYGKRVGADVVVVSFQNMQKVKKYFRTTVPEEESITILDTTNKNKETKSKKITIRTDKDMYVPYTIINFDQDVLFLKKIDDTKAPWEYVKEDFKLQQSNDTDPYLGNWMGYKTCRIEIHSTEDEYLGFVNETNCIEKPKINRMLYWKNGDIRLRINKQSKQGFYLNKDKIPILIKSQINKFNYLELTDQNTDQIVISFQKN